MSDVPESHPRYVSLKLARYHRCRCGEWSDLYPRFDGARPR